MPTFPNSLLIVGLVVFLLLFLLIILTVSLIYNKPQPKAQPSPTKQTRTHQKERHEEVIDTLDWMLQHSIIDTTEYNKLITKSLPYLNG